MILLTNMLVASMQLQRNQRLNRTSYLVFWYHYFTSCLKRSKITRLPIPRNCIPLGRLPMLRSDLLIFL